jgi:hypothetical protein
MAGSANTTRLKGESRKVRLVLLELSVDFDIGIISLDKSGLVVSRGGSIAYAGLKSYGKYCGMF